MSPDGTINIVFKLFQACQQVFTLKIVYFVCTCFVVRYTKQVFADKRLLLESGGQNPFQRVKPVKRQAMTPGCRFYIVLSVLHGSCTFKNSLSLEKTTGIFF